MPPSSLSHPYLLAYRFDPGKEYRTEISLLTEGRARNWDGTGEAASERVFVIRTRVLRNDGHMARLEMLVEEARTDGDPALTVGQTYPCDISVHGEVRGAGSEQVLPGAFYPLPTRPVPVGWTWRAQARPYQFTTDVVVEYGFEKVDVVSGRQRAVIGWRSPSVALPGAAGGRREFRAWGAYALDLEAGRLVEARSITRTRQVGPGWESDAIAQLDMKNLTPLT